MEREIGVAITNGHIEGKLKYRDVHQLWKDIRTLVKRIATIACIIAASVFGYQTKAQQNDLQNQIHILNQKLDRCQNALNQQLEEKIKELEQKTTNLIPPSPRLNPQ